MKKTAIAIMLVCLLFTSCDSSNNSNSEPKKTASKEKDAKTDNKSSSDSTPSTNSKNENPEKAKEGKASMFIIDVRSEKEWKAGHLKDAVHIPHTEILEGIKKVTSDKDAKIYMHCKVGGRADIAKAALEKEGFTNIENLGSLEEAREFFKKNPPK